ncbi:hypothetical protein FRC00_013572 [Tulasnella sp. 408]|nr:hypothetical protein FRC00_013572 [Tulasnella sp. 408]
MKKDRINKLPPELLVYIFHQALADLHPDIRYSTALRQLRLVCSWWARIIDEAGTLWATTSCLDPGPAVEMALRKCRGSLLHVSCRCDVYRTAYCSYVDRILPYSHLWYSLQVKASSLTTITVLLQEPAPNLRKLSINFPPGSDNAQVVPAIPGTTIANLHEFSIHSCKLLWGEASTTNLRQLVLRNVKNVHIVNALEVLRQAKSLTELVVSRCQLLPVHRDVESGEVALPNLENLVLENIDSYPLAQLLIAIAHPTTTSLQVVTLFEIDTWKAVASRFSTQFERAASSLQNPNLLSFSIRVGKKSLQFCCGGHFLHFFGPLGWMQEGPEMTPDPPRHPMENKWGAFACLMDGHFGRALEPYKPRLTIEGPPDGTSFYGRSQVIAMCALSFPRTTHLQLIASDAGLEGMVRALTLEYAAEDGSDQPKLRETFHAFPDLTTLRLDEKVGWGRSAEERRKAWMSDQLNDGLYILVRRRKSDPHSKPIRSLIIRGRVVPDDRLHDLSRIVSALVL